MRPYKIRYSVEDWGKPQADGDRDGSTPVAPGVIVSSTDYGYADDLLLVSIIRKPAGNIDDMLILSTEGPGPYPSDKLLRAVRDEINEEMARRRVEEAKKRT